MDEIQEHQQSRPTQTLSPNQSEGSEGEDANHPGNFGIKSFVKKTRFMSQIASVNSLAEGKSEPLPYINYNEFTEKYNVEKLNININLFEDTKHVFKPSVPIDVKVQAKRKSRAHLINQFNYTIVLTHDNFTWSVNRNYKEIKEIHKCLSKIVKKELGRACSDFEINEVKPEWPIFPNERDHQVLANKVEERCQIIADYLQRVLAYPPYRDHPLMWRFLRVSPFSFLNGVSRSSIEDYLHKHTYENIYFGNCSGVKKCCGENFNLMNKKRWFAVKDTYIAYLNPNYNNCLGYTMLVDRKFDVRKKIKVGAYYALVIKNLHRSWVLKFKTSEQRKEWHTKIIEMLQSTAYCFYNSELLENGSFAPVRSFQKCKWYVNAAEYMENVMDAINHAEEEIFITDWWLCPELYLKRPTHNINHRLDMLLLKKSRQNVKIYIMIYKEISLVLGLASERAKCVLSQTGRNPNIKVLLHPKNMAPNFTPWSHHEKMVVVDQTIAFFGGIDLCYGRWDDDEHRLIDVANNIDTIDLKKYPRISAFKNIENKDNSEDLNGALRNLITSTALTCDLTLATNSKTTLNVEETILTFNKINKDTDNIPLEEGSDSEPESKADQIKRKLKKMRKRIKRLNFDETKGLNSDKQELCQTSDSEYSEGETINPQEIRYWPGKDYSNSYREDFKDIHEYAKDQFDRNEVPRMPWRDQALVVIGESARDLARHFIQRWNQAKYELESKNLEYPFLLPKSYSDPINYEYEYIFDKPLHKCTVQILRSLDTWSGGISHIECSIMNAYCDLIDKAEHYIYIENQFFVTTTEPKKDQFVKNRIGASLVKRIYRAFKENKKFRVFVCVPLFPSFDNMSTILAVQYFNLRSIKFGEFSIYNALIEAGVPDPSEYITFHGMRNWTVLMGKLMQEIIYVHSKLMIVDDKHVICGSANINDRSMLGSRDSEVAGLVKDEEFIDSVLDNQKVKVGKYAYALRTKIFKLHLGIYFKNPNLIDVADCVCDEFYKNFKIVSHKNTSVYDEVFKCLPSDNVLTLSELKNYTSYPCLSNSDPVAAKKLLEEEVMGYIVDFPLKFLSNEKNFFPKITTTEGIAPTSTWT